MEELSELLTLLGGFGILAGAFAWLIRSVIGQVLSRDIEKFKKSLSSEVEALKTELSSHARRDEVRFQALHEKRLQGVGEFHGALLRATDEYKNVNLAIVFDAASVEQALHAASDSLRLAQQAFARYRLFFAPSFVDDVQPLLEQLDSALIEMITARALAREGPKDVPIDCAEHLVDLVEVHFRSLLGVCNETTSIANDKQ